MRRNKAALPHSTAATPKSYARKHSNNSIAEAEREKAYDTAGIIIGLSFGLPILLKAVMM